VGEILFIAAVFAVLLSLIVQPALIYDVHQPQRGDIVVAGNPLSPGATVIERVIGLPGENVRIAKGHVYIDGRLLCEPYLRDEGAPPWRKQTTWPSDGQAYFVPLDHYFLLGDDRNLAVDSRVFGAVGRGDLHAWVWARVLPVSRIGSVDTGEPVQTSTAYPGTAGCT
jgi:signal peptidase I